MEGVKQKKSFSYILFAIIFSGICWYFSNGLTGHFWYLLWPAPVAVLLVSLNSSWKISFLVSFIAYLIGRLSWFSYLVTVMTLVPAIIAIFLMAFIFAVVIIMARKIILKTRSWLSVFAFPVLFTSYEFLLMSFSPDGTASSIAYSQSDFLPAIQIASITGISGITFLVTLFPSAIAVAWFFRKQPSKIKPIIIIPSIIILSALLFGTIRMSNHSDDRKMVAGLVVLEEKSHDISKKPDFQNAILVVKKYAQEIEALASKGAKLVVLPERAININAETDTESVHILSNVAKQEHVAIVAGYTNFKNEKKRNSALVINDEGSVLIDYNKVHLVKGFEDWFAPGTDIGLFKLNTTQAGIAICKDLDFPNYIRGYSKNMTSIVCIPAWDFVVDDWVHSRMAILRGVENGFSEVRTAREGRLTISDYDGSMIAETSCSNHEKATLIGKVSLEKRNTVYTRFGNWFGILNLIAAILFLIALPFFKNKNRN